MFRLSSLTPRRMISLLSIGVLALIAASSFYLAYRQNGAPLKLIQATVVVDGSITEKLVQTRRLSPLPLDMRAYVVRYAFPNPQGQMRTGEQIVTKAFYDWLGDQGAPVEVFLREDDLTFNAVDPRITFPSVSGVRMWIAGGCVLAAYFILLFGVMSNPDAKKSLAPATPHTE
jgi:hypothetical protein